MKFAIYEEFPQEDNLEKLTHLNFPIDIIVASKNLREFHELQRQIKNTNSNVQRVGYWPVLAIEEGYWLSPFSKKEALERIISELEDPFDDNTLLLKWDAELPVFLNKELMVKEAKNFFSNRGRIREFLKQHKDYRLELVTAEWPTFLTPERIQRAAGVAFDPEEYDSNKVKMAYGSFKKQFYKSFRKFIPNKIADTLFKKEVRKGVRNYGERFSIGVGCLDTGIFGDEPIMNPEEFEADLTTAQEEGVSKAFIFRLGGINPDYSGIMKQFHS